MSKTLLPFMAPASQNLPAKPEHGMAKSEPVPANSHSGKANVEAVKARNGAGTANSHSGRASTQPVTAKTQRGMAKPQAVRAKGQSMPLKSTLFSSFYIQLLNKKIPPFGRNDNANGLNGRRKGGERSSPPFLLHTMINQLSFRPKEGIS